MKTLLVIDDEAKARKSIKLILTQAGYQVVTASNAAAGLRQLKKRKISLVILDIMMPGMTVREFVKKEKAKILFLTLVRLSSAEKKSLKKLPRIVDFLQKPVDASQLLAKIKKIVKP